jgi:hypothetical protein
VDGNNCAKKSGYDDMCSFHSKIIGKLKKYGGWIIAKKFYEEYEYTGEHWKKCDDDGPIPIYHYISKKRFSSRSVEELDKWDYDQ